MRTYARERARVGRVIEDGSKSKTEVSTDCRGLGKYKERRKEVEGSKVIVSKVVVSRYS